MCCHHERKFTKRQSEPKSLLKLGLGIGSSLLLIGAGYGYWNNVQIAKADFLKYSPQDVVYTQPLHAEHLHQTGVEIPIPFLPKEQPQPKIAVSEQYYDFGSVGAKEIVKRTFVVRNTGKAPLTISRAYTSCGCTTADISATVIPPGKVALVNVIFDVGFHDTRGQTVRRGIMLENNDRTQPKMEIWIKADVRQN